jgi:hypothetical protein
MSAQRWCAWLAGLWGGALLAIALIAVPSGFATLPTADAGRVAGRIFAQEAYLGLALAVGLLLAERRRAGVAAARSQSSRFSAEMLLLLGALFCTVAGYFVVQPMLAEARAGRLALSFGALHAVSMAFFALKALLVLTLAWRLAPRA